jgi:hypothetical protein
MLLLSGTVASDEQVKRQQDRVCISQKSYALIYAFSLAGSIEYLCICTHARVDYHLFGPGGCLVFSVAAARAIPVSVLAKMSVISCMEFKKRCQGG